MSNVMTLTSRNQVTIPKEIREELGVRPHDKIEFYIEDGEVKLKKAFPSWEEVVGGLPALDLDITVEEAIELAKEERARALVAKLKSA